MTPAKSGLFPGSLTLGSLPAAPPQPAVATSHARLWRSRIGPPSGCQLAGWTESRQPADDSQRHATEAGRPDSSASFGTQSRAASGRPRNSQVPAEWQSLLPGSVYARAAFYASTRLSARPHAPSDPPPGPFQWNISLLSISYIKRSSFGMVQSGWAAECARAASDRSVDL